MRCVARGMKLFILFNNYSIYSGGSICWNGKWIKKKINLIKKFLNTRNKSGSVEFVEVKHNERY